MSMMLINGVAGDTINVMDRGLQYGDGLFETMRIEAGTIPLWERHMRRLKQGCMKLAIPFPDVALLKSEADQLISGVSDKAVLKLIITRGQGGRGYAFEKGLEPTRLFMLADWPDYPEKNWQDGVMLHVCATRVGGTAQTAGIKHLNRLDQVLARNEWGDSSIFADGLMLDHQANIIEGTMSNFFMVQGGVMKTPDLTEAGVAGIMRDQILELAAIEGIPSRICQMTLLDVLTADECFITNSLIGIWPVTGIQDSRYKRGPITERLMEKLAER